jgi:putative oxidoreductase
MSIDIVPLLLALGRVLLGGLFVYGGIHHFFMIPQLTEVMAARGVPFPRAVLIAGSIFQAAAGALLMLGSFVPAAAFGLVVFTLLASVMLVNFWDQEGPARQTARNVFQSNLAIIGGLLVAAAEAM